MLFGLWKGGLRNCWGADMDKLSEGVFILVITFFVPFFFFSVFSFYRAAVFCFFSLFHEDFVGE